MVKAKTSSKYAQVALPQRASQAAVADLGSLRGSITMSDARVRGTAQTGDW
jgi:hypothetical protein